MNRQAHIVILVFSSSRITHQTSSTCFAKNEAMSNCRIVKVSHYRDTYGHYSACHSHSYSYRTISLIKPLAHTTIVID